VCNHRDGYSVRLVHDSRSLRRRSVCAVAHVEGVGSRGATTNGRKSEDQFARLNRPPRVGQQRVSALAFADPMVQALLATLVLFCFVPRGFSNRDVRERLALMLGVESTALTPGRMTYHLRRLRLHGLIQRLPRSHRYRLTNDGLRPALFCTRIYHRVLRPALTDLIASPQPRHPHCAPTSATWRPPLLTTLPSQRWPENLTQSQHISRSKRG